MKIPRTQKGRGVAAMLCYPPWGEHVPDSIFVQEKEDLVWLKEWWGQNGESFVRPCPPVPEHGYQDSKVCKTVEEVGEMLEATLAVHPKSELMLMPKVDAQLSFVWTPGKVVVGKGNAGATSGDGVLFEIPLVPVQIPGGLLEAAGIPPTVTPYIEGLVAGYANTTWLAQLRYGPEPPRTPDYIPRDVIVKRVIKAEGDLIEWGKVIKTLEEGDVVDHVGGHLVSHYGVHCINAGVAILTTRVPMVGEKLEKTVEDGAPTIDVEKVQRWMLYAMRGAASITWGNQVKGQLCAAALFVLHNVSAIAPVYPELIGASLAVLLKLGIAACLGEARHYTGSGEWMHGTSRDAVYTSTLKNFYKNRAKLEKVLELFETGYQPGGGIGGYPWAKCTTTVIKLERAMRGLAAEADGGKFAEVIIAANEMVNEAHNGGWWLNKFCAEEVFDRCSVGDPVMVGMAVMGLIGMLNMPKMSVEKVITRIVEKQRKDWVEGVEIGWRGVRYRPSSGHSVAVDLENRLVLINTGRVQFAGKLGQGEVERLEGLGKRLWLQWSGQATKDQIVYSVVNAANNIEISTPNVIVDPTQLVCMSKRSLPVGVAWADYDLIHVIQRWKALGEVGKRLCEVCVGKVVQVDAQQACTKCSKDEKFVSMYTGVVGCHCGCGRKGEVEWTWSKTAYYSKPTCEVCAMKISMRAAAEKDEERKGGFGEWRQSRRICASMMCACACEAVDLTDTTPGQVKCFAHRYSNGAHVLPVSVTLQELIKLGMPGNE